MNLDFKILWFDDQSIDAHKRFIKEFLKEQYELNLYVRVNKGNENIADIDIEQYDLILMDYGLIGNETGVSKYKEIRDRFSYVDIAFYSTTMDRCKDDLYKLEKDGVDVEGVYYLEVNNDTLFEEKIKAIINKIVRRSESISNLRGLILSETSKFDIRIHDLIVSLINKYKLRETINNYLSKEIHENICSSFSKTEDKYLTHNCKIGFYFDESLTLPRLDASKQVRVLNKVLKEIRKKGVYISSEFDNFNDRYLKDIINVRNAFAHQAEKSGKIIIDKNEIVINDLYHKSVRNTLACYSELLGKIEKL